MRRIEGQARGIQRMLDENRSCEDVLCQLSAMNEAIRGVSLRVAEHYALECLEGEPKKGRSKRTVAALLDALVRAPR